MNVTNTSAGIVRVDVDEDEYVFAAGETKTGLSGRVATMLITGHPELQLAEEEG